MRYFFIFSVLLVIYGGCGSSARREATAFLSAYNTRYQSYVRSASEASWAANTYIVAGDSSRAEEEAAAEEALARYTGSRFVLDKANELLTKKGELTPLQVRQLETILYIGAPNAESIEEVVSARIAEESKQNQVLFGFDFRLNGRSMSTNAIDSLLRTSTRLAEREAVWRASKAVGRPLKVGLGRLRDLRNQCVQSLGYDDYFAYQVSDYGMSSQEMRALCKRLVKEVWPLYRHLHTYARYTLAERYGEEVPDMLPAHWLPNRWGQDWSALVEVKQSQRLNEALAEKGPEWMMQQAENFYVSIGFAPLPETFYTQSSLYELPKDAPYKKNNHASAWHIDLGADVRSLMSVATDDKWYETVHHELGHVYYFMAYSKARIPIVLRRGANRAFHEAIGSLIGLAVMQNPFVGDIEDKKPDTTNEANMDVLLKEALQFVVFLPWAAGVMTEFEGDLYGKPLSEDAFNTHWWAAKKRYQGIVPPDPRDPLDCDPATKTHMINDAAQYYDYALSYALLFQLHAHIARDLLDEDPHQTRYYGRKEVGTFLRQLLSSGATKDWRALLQSTLGEDIQAKALLDYFAPLQAHLETLNAERMHTLPAEGP